MAKYELRGGGVVSGETARDILEAIRASSFNPKGDLGAFLSDVAKRCKEYDGSVIRTDTYEHTLEDLIACSFLTLLK